MQPRLSSSQASFYPALSSKAVITDLKAVIKSLTTETAEGAAAVAAS